MRANGRSSTRQPRFLAALPCTSSKDERRAGPALESGTSLCGCVQVSVGRMDVRRRTPKKRSTLKIDHLRHSFGVMAVVRKRVRHRRRWEGLALPIPLNAVPKCLPNPTGRAKGPTALRGSRRWVLPYSLVLSAFVNGNSGPCVGYFRPDDLVYIALHLEFSQGVWI